MIAHVSRRDLLRTGGALSLAALLDAQVSSNAPSSKLGMPGLYPGRVAAVSSPDCLAGGRYQAGPIQRMIRRGMAELTATDGGPEGWKQFFSPGDVVGIKVNPNSPYVLSSAEVLREIINGLNSAGIHNRDIVVYDRYRRPFVDAGIPSWLPEGVRTASATEDYTGDQTGIDGYDPDHYMEMALSIPGHAGEVKYRRSHAALFITRQVNKLINLAVLKHHQSAGVTLALKNLSHGLVNNVNRSHISPTANACGAFIPAVVSMPVIRSKAVLHILDGTKGLYHGGPRGAQAWVWEHQTIYFATDAVALDHIGLKAIDHKRLTVGMKKVAEAAPDRSSIFVHPQPEHIELAGALGLGIFDEKTIDLRRLRV